jgi:pimeloyl-ACP methyl ester carboxylesterase
MVPGISRRHLLTSFIATAATLPLMSSAFASLEGMRTAKLFYTEAGKGRNLMLLHGWVSDSHDWSWQLPVLEKHYHTVAVDLRGHGRSEVMPAGQYRPDHYAADIISLIETKFTGEKFTLIGHSMGGQIAARVAAFRPDLVDAVVSVDGSLGFSEQLLPVFQGTAEQLQTGDPVAVTQAMLENFYDPATSPAFKVWHARRMMGMPLAPFRESFGPLFLGEGQAGVGKGSELLLRHIKAPFYHMCRFKAQAEQMRGWLINPKSKVDVWEHAGHWIMQDRPDDVNTALTAWIDQL